MKRIKKGMYGYRNSFKRRQMIRIAILGLFILAQLGARYFTDNQALKNILTVMAVITVLPTANLAAPLVAVWRYKTPSEEFHQKYVPCEQNYPILYDLIITTKDDVMPMDVIAVHPTGIYACCINRKVDVQRAEKALNETLKSQTLAPNLKLTKDLNTFDKRIKSLKPVPEYEADEKMDLAMRVLKSMSM